MKAYKSIEIDYDNMQEEDRAYQEELLAKENAKKEDFKHFDDELDFEETKSSKDEKENLEENLQEDKEDKEDKE